MNDIPAFYSAATAIFAGIGAAFILGFFTGIWIILRFCEVQRVPRS